MIVLAAGLAAPTSAPVAGPLASAMRAAADPLAGAVRAAISTRTSDPELAAFYAARNYRPLWIDGRRVRPEARVLIAALQDAAAENLRPADYDPAGVAAAVRGARSGRPAALARAELALSRALGAYGEDLHRAKAGAEMLYTDAAVQPALTTERSVLETAAAAPTLAQGLAAVRRMNPIYDALRVALAHEAAAGGTRAALIRANLERARALPIDLGRRYVLVDIAAQRLWMYQDGRPRDSMRVVVGKPSEPTPSLAGVIRYAVFRPYWNVPPDLVRASVAPKVLAQGLGYFHAQHFEALSDWSDDARVLDPAAVDWKAVVAGREELRVRQRPGRGNMMGQMKFIFPNDLGVYLHDTPLRSLFADDQRTASAGCVRLEDAARLGRWLLSAEAVEAAHVPGPPEERVNLAEPTPVYLVYLTAEPAGGALSLRPDIYGRDRGIVADAGGPVSMGQGRLAAAR